MKPSIRLFCGLAVLAVAAPTLAAAAASAAPAAAPAVPYLAIAGVIWFAADKIIDMLPIKESTAIEFIRKILNSFFAGKRQ